MGEATGAGGREWGHGHVSLIHILSLTFSLPLPSRLLKVAKMLTGIIHSFIHSVILLLFMQIWHKKCLCFVFFHSR